MSNIFKNTTNGFAQLKNIYEGPIVDLISEEIPVYRAAEKVKKAYSGLQVIRSLRTSRNQGVGATAEGGVLPKIGAQVTSQAIIAAKYNYLRFGVTAQMIKSSQSDVGSFVRAAGYELEMGYKDLKTELNRQLCWNGTGTLATVNTASSSSTALVIQGRTSTEAALKYIDLNTTFDLVNAAGTAVIANDITVTAITTGTSISSTATLTLDQPITAPASGTLIRAGSFGNEIQGIFTALDGGTTTVYNINRATTLSYQGNVNDLTGTANPLLSIDAMQNPYNAGLQRGNVAAYNAAYTDFTGLRYYQKLLTADKRYTSMEGDGTFGNKGKFYLDFNGISVVPDKDMPTRFVFMPAEVLKYYVLCEMEFADESGSMYIVQNEVDSFEVRIRLYGNLFNEQPAACGVLQGFQSP